MRKLIGLLLIFYLCKMEVRAAGSLTDSLRCRLEMQASLSGGDHTPLWLNANKYGLSSLDKSNGYARVALERPLSADRADRWGVGYGLDVAAAYNYSSRAVVQQAWVETRWLRGVLTVGAKEWPMELKNQRLSSGSQTFGVNARPVPQVRLALPGYWTIPGVGWLALKGHLAYGLTTDDSWQKDFTHQTSKYTENTLYHSKAGYLRIGRETGHVNLELGLELASQFGGTSYVRDTVGLKRVENEGGLKGMWHALVPGGGDALEDVYRNNSGNMLGSWLVRLNMDYDTWQLGIYADHFFEDSSGIYFMGDDSWQSGDDWNKRGKTRFALYDIRDMMLGADLKFRHGRWIDGILVEYLYTKYQSGPVYHDRTPSMPDAIGGKDGYYRHYLFTGWQHWGQVMGNPLYLSPLYNKTGEIDVLNSRFTAWHFGVSGHPACGLDYRLLLTWQRGLGTYWKPYTDPKENVSLMAEATYRFPTSSWLNGWAVRASYGMDRGKIMGDNDGLQLTIRKEFRIKN